MCKYKGLELPNMKKKKWSRKIGIFQYEDVLQRDSSQDSKRDSSRDSVAWQKIENLLLEWTWEYKSTHTYLSMLDSFSQSTQNNSTRIAESN